VRIWYQSFVDLDAQAPYIRRLQARLDRYGSPGTEIRIHGISPPDRHFHPITEFRCADQVLRNVLKAQKEGFDAFVIGHFQEPGLRECRGAVDIPVIGMGEACLLHACSLGRKIGLVTIHPAFIPYHEIQVTGHGLEQRLAGIRALQADLPRFMAVFTDPEAGEALRRDFVAQARPLVEAGADVLIPAGGLPMLALAELHPLSVDGALVMEGIVTLLRAAETAVDLYRITGNAAGRSGFYARASEDAIADFLAPRE